jgi:uncharacterized protein YdeI (YjbR/CyaY-like superfamily)
VEAIAYADARLEAPKTVNEIYTPDELTEALDADPDRATAFYAQTLGR